MDPVTIVATVIARPQTREELQAILLSQVGPTRGEDGCVTYELHVDPADPCVFVF